jgi:uncharacterized protein
VRCDGRLTPSTCSDIVTGFQGLFAGLDILENAYPLSLRQVRSCGHAAGPRDAGPERFHSFADLPEQSLIVALKMHTSALSMRAELGALAHMLFGKGRGALLALFFGHPDQFFFYRQITRQLGNISAGTPTRTGDALPSGLVDRTTVGKQVFYRANQNHPVFSELRALVAKTVDAIQVLREALASIAERVAVAFIYGSMAQHKEKAESDIDLLIVGNVTLEDVLGCFSHVELSLGCPVNPTAYSLAEFKAKLASGNHFLNSVVRGEKIFLIGDENELREVGGIRMAKAGANESR